MKYKILCDKSLSQIQMWLNQYNTNSGGDMSIECPITTFVKAEENNQLYFMCTIKFKPWDGFKG